MRELEASKRALEGDAEDLQNQVARNAPETETMGALGGIPAFFASESYYGSPPNFSYTKSPVLKNSSRPYLLEYDAPCRPNAIVR